MNIFKYRNQLINDYESYIKSFIKVNDGRIKEKIDAEFQLGALWPEPLIQLNPSFEPGQPINQLAAQGIVIPSAAGYFRPINQRG